MGVPVEFTSTHGMRGYLRNQWVRAEPTRAHVFLGYPWDPCVLNPVCMYPFVSFVDMFGEYPRSYQITHNLHGPPKAVQRGGSVWALF